MNVLFVCESVSKSASGGKVVNFVTDLLLTNGHAVYLFCLNKTDSGNNKNDIITYATNQSKVISGLKHFIKGADVKQFKKVMANFNPDIVHVSSFLPSKSRFFIEYAKFYSAKVFLQPWTHHFFCHQGYAFRDGKACDLCVEKGYLQSIKNRCATIKNIHSIISRSFIQHSALKANGFLSSNTFMDEILLKYGIGNEKIFRFPIPYEIKDVKELNKGDEEDFFIFYGQPTKFKGIDILINTFVELKNIRLKIFPAQFYQPKKELPSNIEIINEISWNNGLDDAIKKAKAVVLPTLWPTTTEYALYEAMNYKKAIVAFNVGAHKEILTDGYNALVAEQNDFQKFKNSIILLNENKELKRKLGENAFKSLQKLTSNETIYKILMKVYTEVN